MRSGWDTSKETRHELPRVHRAPVRVLGPRADAAGGAGNPPAPRRLPSLRRAWWLAAGAIAAAAADTWATEVGTFSPFAPRLITTGARVGRGASGGITALGTAGGVAGALLIALVARWVGPRGAAPGSAVLITAAGVAGMLADSLLGATVQGKFECPACDARFERGNSVCHEPVRLIRGWRWLDNDGVNLAATLVGASVAALGSQ